MIEFAFKHLQNDNFNLTHFIFQGEMCVMKEYGIENVEAKFSKLEASVICMWVSKIIDLQTRMGGNC